MTRLLTLTLGLFLSFSLALQAQQSGGVKCYLLTYAPSGLPNDFQAFYRSGEEINPFRSSQSSLGVPVLYQGPRRFVLRASEADFAPPAEGEAPKPPLAFVDLPAGANNVLILALPKGETEGVRLVAYDLSTDELKKGDYRAFNFSNQAIAVKMGKQQFALKPGQDRFVKDGSWGSEAKALPLQVAISEGGKAKLVYSSYWEHYPQRRSLLFFFNGHHRTAPIVFSSFNAVAGAPLNQE
ncbi:MAG: hypothetical protein ACQKBY_09095 [Verrucomicrobiales bacterium]